MSTEYGFITSGPDDFNSTNTFIGSLLSVTIKWSTSYIYRYTVNFESVERSFPLNGFLLNVSF